MTLLWSNRDCQEKGVILVLLDLTAAYDTESRHAPAADAFYRSKQGYAPAWLTFYLSYRTRAVETCDAISRQQPLFCDVVHGSVLGPLLFIICGMLITAIFPKHNAKYDIYADDMKYYTEFHRNQPGEIEDAIGIIQRCTPDVKRMMPGKHFVLNERKTE